MKQNFNLLAATAVFLMVFGMPLRAASQVRFREVIRGLDQPTYVTGANDGTGRLFVTEKNGRIIVTNANGTGKRVFLNVSQRVNAEGERGLLSIAFHPGYRTNGRFFIYYNDLTGADTLWEYKRSRSSANRADTRSARRLLRVPKRFSNHNGGQLAFGPDGYLYVSLGDGGGGGDPDNNAQNLSTPLGKILRIDVSPKRGYRIPPDNPFVSVPGVEKAIFAYGLRNPWRFSFDRGILFAADVGQVSVEEIDIIESGKNYGWPVTEGSLCFRPPSGCDRSGLEMPIFEYDRSQGSTVIGGYVYRGRKAPAIRGAYVYGDAGSGRIWTLRKSEQEGNWQNQLIAGTSFSISSFGKDDRGELYVVDLRGTIYRIER